ncbi:hypothetical protein A3Q56_02189, partial [Intoshia linei]
MQEKKTFQKNKKSKNVNRDLKGKNPKAYAFNSVNKISKRIARSMDMQESRKHIPIKHDIEQEPPLLIVIAGPSKCGKTTLLKSLLLHYTNEKITNIKGPVTVVSGKKQRLTFMESNNDICTIIDLIKVADLVITVVNARIGFEMESFEIINICQTHGFPRILGVLTHFDLFNSIHMARKTKKTMKQRFWTEIYDGMKLFNFDRNVTGYYNKNEIGKMTRYFHALKLRPMPWKLSHSYLLADRIEYANCKLEKSQNEDGTVKICVYGYVRGTHMSQNTDIHIPGCGDYKIAHISNLNDPCAAPSIRKCRTLMEKERIIYAPMSGFGGVTIDDDHAVYVPMGDYEKISGNNEQNVNLLDILPEEKCDIFGDDENFSESGIENKVDSSNLNGELEEFVYSSLETVPFAAGDSVNRINYPSQYEQIYKARFNFNELGNCFMTGEWDSDEDADKLLEKDSTNQNNEVKDVEMDDKISESEDDENLTEREKNIKKKIKRKMAFNVTYDRNKMVDKGNTDEVYQNWKKLIENKKEMDKIEFANEQKNVYDGSNVGDYVKVTIDNVPIEFMKNLDTNYPCIVGCLLTNEMNSSYVQIRIKRHRWFGKTLKNGDPLILSIGWRRVQTIPFYATTDDNGRHRLLKYTPQYMHCMGYCWTNCINKEMGVVGIQSVSDDKKTNRFRIAATGVVLGNVSLPNVVKKLKLVGHPSKIFKKTAFIDGMFNSETEAAKFEGSTIRSVSGIRGCVKKIVLNKNGVIRATFEDKLVMKKQLPYSMKRRRMESKPKELNICFKPKTKIDRLVGMMRMLESNQNKLNKEKIAHRTPAQMEADKMALKRLDNAKNRKK